MRFQDKSLQVLVVALIGVLGCAHRAAADAEDLSDADKTVVKAAVEVLKAKSDFLTEEAKKHAEDKDFQAFVARFQAGVMAFKAVLARGDVKKEDFGNTKGGKTVGNGEELNLDGSQGARSGDNQVILNERILTPDKCSPDFLRLLQTITHESTHLNQKITTLPPKPESPALEKFLERSPSDLLKLKRSLIKLELEAYSDEFRLLLQIVDGLRAIQDNDKAGLKGAHRADDVPPYMSALLECTPKQITELLEDSDRGVPEMARRLPSILGSLRALEKLDKKLGGEGKSDSDIAEALDKDQRYQDIRGKFGEEVGLHSSSSEIRVSVKDGPTRFLETGIEHPQDAQLLMDAHGHPHLLVCGYETATTRGGIVREFDLSIGGPTVEHGTPTGSILISPVPGLNYKDLCTATHGLEHPSSILVAPSGQVYVWDLERRSLFPMPDDDGDGVPDRVDLVAANRPAPQWALDHFAVTSWFEGSVVLEIRVGDRLDFGDLPVFQLHDRNGDGFFEATTPTSWSRLLPRGHR